MRRIVPAALATVAALTLAAPAAAQQAAAAGAAAPGSANAAVAAIASSYQPVNRYLLAAAEQMPDSLFSYRPTPSVRTVAQLLAHISNFHNLGCAAAMGEQPASRENLEQTRTTKAQVIDALRTSGAVCERAFAQSDAAAAGTVKLFGQDRSRLAVLNMVAGHDWEHYGNLVTYMRIAGMVPPSSQQ